MSETAYLKFNWFPEITSKLVFNVISACLLNAYAMFLLRFEKKIPLAKFIWQLLDNYLKGIYIFNLYYKN